MSIPVIACKWKINIVHIRPKYKTLVNLSIQTCRASSIKIQYTPLSFSISVDQLSLLINTYRKLVSSLSNSLICKFKMVIIQLLLPANRP